MLAFITWDLKLTGKNKYIFFNFIVGLVVACVTVDEVLGSIPKSAKELLDFFKKSLSR